MKRFDPISILNILKNETVLDMMVFWIKFLLHIFYFVIYCMYFILLPLQAAFLLPVLTGMMANGLNSSAFSAVQEPQALVVAPTRELAVQISLLYISQLVSSCIIWRYFTRTPVEKCRARSTYCCWYTRASYRCDQQRKGDKLYTL